MIDIIKAGNMKGKLDHPIYFKCSRCECIFTADEEDDYDMRVNSAHNDTYITIVCPWCGAEVCKDIKTVSK